MASDTTISTVALAIALVALVTTVSQVIGQFLATADGYRRCQPSVMGRWAKSTRRKFRWSEMRFETIYRTPFFGLSHPSDQSPTALAAIQIDGTIASMRDTYCEPTVDNRDGFKELVSWVRFIEALHKSTGETLRNQDLNRGEKYRWGLEFEMNGAIPRQCSRLLPNLTHQQRSWDFVPPDVVRPLAAVGISDIAILARRLGMTWKEFDPSEGKMKAEGNGHMITSTMVRSIGTVLQISIKDPLPSTYSPEDRNELYILNDEADKMGFGIITLDKALGRQIYKLGTEEDVHATVRIHVGMDSRDSIIRISQANPGWTPGISDIIGFASPILRRYGSSIVRVPKPSGYAEGLTLEEVGFVVFYNRLRDLVSERDAQSEPVSAQTRLILEQWEELRDKYGAQWDDPQVCNRQLNDRNIAFLDDLHERHEAAVQYLHNLVYRPGRPFTYTDLMYSHIKFAVDYFPNALERINADPSRARDKYGIRVPDWTIEGAHVYWDNIPKIVKEMEARGCRLSPEVVEEAWLTMMWKAFLWHRCHFMVEGPRVPSAHYGSKLPVYIG